MQETFRRSVESTAPSIRVMVVDDSLTVRKITTRLPSFGEAFTQQVPLTLRSLDNVLLQPHVAGFTEEAFAAGMDLVRRNLLAHFSGQPLITPIPV